MCERIEAARDRLAAIIDEYYGPTLNECDAEVLAANAASVAASERLKNATAELEAARVAVDSAVRRCRMARFYQESAARHEAIVESWAELVEEMSSCDAVVTQS